MKTLFLLFSHSLTEDQKQDAQDSLGVSEFVSLPDDLQKLFSNVPPELEELDEYLDPIINWIDNHAYDESDYILIQGDYGATVSLNKYLSYRESFATPIYATTERMSVDTIQEDGSIVTTRVFKHKRFRKY
jgi:hypothetical protein